MHLSFYALRTMALHGFLSYAAVWFLLKAPSCWVEIFKPENLGVDVTPRIKTLKVSEPPKRSVGTHLNDAALYSAFTATLPGFLLKDTV
ncbi:MAG TPA: hypothetical protein PLE48_11440 [Thiobacillus sp.]|jgi:hypothetical protein|nr:MAG: hypothetical protein B7Y64_13170 [Acidovorax sp. 35-64-16]OZA68627.1 MAG: hypothetical protein B7X70_13940 [Acidovorax sp. 39-64-12]HQT71025.1 hypothetical protein [Thiobacillus sp.]